MDQRPVLVQNIHFIETWKLALRKMFEKRWKNAAWEYNNMNTIPDVSGEVGAHGIRFELDPTSSVMSSGFIPTFHCVVYFIVICKLLNSIFFFIFG